MKNFAILGIHSARVKNLKNGDIQELTSKLVSGHPGKNLFLKDLQFGDFCISFRFDYSDKNKNGDPTLDADIKLNGIKFKQENETWHHTERKKLGNLWLYHFQFQEIDFLFQLETTHDKLQFAKARIVKPEV